MTLRILPAGDIDPGVSHTFKEGTLDEVADAVVKLGEVGLADFEFNLDFDHAGGRLTRVDLTMTLTIDMPEWPNASDRPRAEREEWNRFLCALRIHEDGHIDIFRREATVSFKAVEKAEPSTIRRVLAKEKMRLRRLSKAYDLRTRHGQEQQTRCGTTVIVPP